MRRWTRKALPPKALDRLAVLTPCTILLSTGLALAAAPLESAVLPTAGLASLCICTLLAHAWRRAPELACQHTGSDVRWIKAHIITHVVPAGFAFAHLSTGTTPAPDPAWIVGFALFFYSGRRTWLALEQAFKRPLYVIFRRGNSAMLITTTTLAVVAQLADANAISSFVARVLSIYLIIHLALTGLAVARIDRDLGR